MRLVALPEDLQAFAVAKAGERRVVSFVKCQSEQIDFLLQLPVGAGRDPNQEIHVHDVLFLAVAIARREVNESRVETEDAMGLRDEAQPVERQDPLHPFDDAFVEPVKPDVLENGDPELLRQLGDDAVLGRAGAHAVGEQLEGVVGIRVVPVGQFLDPAAGIAQGANAKFLETQADASFSRDGRFLKISKGFH
ncbi:MAG TPA: hypothetical protein PK919_09580 [Candidatus Aminicenantes bacterium]|nr:hypothetical protein [Candidatus Aminicenantes bacterium]